MKADDRIEGKLHNCVGAILPRVGRRASLLAVASSRSSGGKPRQARVRAAGASNVQSRRPREPPPALSHCVCTLPQPCAVKMVTKKRDRSPSTTPMPTTEPAHNDGSHLTAAQWEGMQKVLNHIYDYRTEEYVRICSRVPEAITNSYTVASIHPNCSTKRSTSASFQNITRRSRSP